MKNPLKRGQPVSFRLIVIGLCILAQLGLTLFLIYKFKIRTIEIYTLFQFIGIALAIYILNKPDNPSYKFAWIMFIILLPLVGCFFYMIRAGSRVSPSVKRRMKRAESAAAEQLIPDRDCASQLKSKHPQAARQSDCLQRLSGFPVFDGSCAEYVYPGEEIQRRLLIELEKAEKSIFIEFFILAEGIMFEQIHKILKEKAACGVDVRIIFDDIGSINRQYRGFISKLQKDGIKVSVFNPIKPSFDMFMNNRNHRKIVVIDLKVAFTGSFNIGDEYINVWRKLGNWLDSAVIVKGKAVHSFSLMFLSMWSFINGTEYQSLELPQPIECDGFVQPYCDGPFNLSNPAEALYMQILHTAERYVYITTPYLILDDKMEIALQTAAQSGVDVRIVTPKKEDKWYVHPVTRSYYAGLIKSGIRIYEFTPGFIHSKLFVSDDTVATVGSVNLDYRSFYFHFECGAWLCGTDSVAAVKQHLEQIFEQSEEITLEKLKNQPLREKVKQAVLRLFAPFM